MIKVVVADDEPKVCQLICGLVDWASLDMEVVGIAHNGVEALDMIQSMAPDLIITDIRMPGYDGLEMIERAKKLDDHIDFIIVSGYRHFEYAQSAIKFGVCDYLLKPIKKQALMETLEKMRQKYLQRTQKLSSAQQQKLVMQNDISKLRANFFDNLISQKAENKKEIQINTLNKEYHFHLKPGCFQVFIIKMDCNYENFYQNSIHVLQDKAKQILQGLLKQECYDLEISFQVSRAYCMLNYPEENKTMIRRQLKAVFDDLFVQNSIFDSIQLTIGLGCMVEELSQLEQSLKSAEWAVYQRVIEGTGKFVESSKCTSNLSELGNFAGDINKTIESGVEILDDQFIEKEIDVLKNQLMQRKDLSGHAVFNLIIMAYSGYLMQLGNQQLLTNDMNKCYKEFVNRADLCTSVNQLFDVLKQEIRGSMEKIRRQKKQEVKKPIRQAKQYIQQNYAQPITLEEISGIVGFNASYFSALFKKESGQNFLEYLSEVRMNQAKELLKETKLSVAKICKQVGYSDLKHFTQSFKKLTGLKPNEFRKLYS